MNKFIKFPLVLAIVGVICAGSLSVVYEITKEKIAYNKNKEAFDLLGGIVTDMTGVEEVLADYDSNKLAKAGIKNMYEVSGNSGVTAYGYLAEVNGYNPGINFLLVLSASENKILGFEVVSHSETNSGTYGGPLLNSPEFAAQFTNISFDDVATSIDYVAGSTAKVTMSAVKTGVDNVIAFHRYEVFGEVDDGINLTATERKMLNLAEGYVMEDKSEEFKTNLKANTSDNKYKSILNALNLLNYVEIKDATGVVKGHAYVVENSYSCDTPQDSNGNGVIDNDDNHGVRTTQTYKLVFMFDENKENTKLIVVNSTDSMGAILPEGLPSITEHEWINTFNGLSISELSTAYENSSVDYIVGATFTSQKIREHIGVIVDAQVRAYND